MDPLDIARDLIRMGAPVFVAKKCQPDCPLHHGQGSISGYDLPARWQLTPIDESTLGRYEPGDALGMVGGYALDVIDVDPQNKGTLIGKPALPRVYGEVATPSGGKHYIIASLGVPKGEVFPGIDLQAGDSPKSRGFVWIAPTVRASKDPADMGRVRPYVWVKRPDPEEFEEWRDLDESGDAWRDARLARQSKAPERAAPVAAGADPFDANPESAGFEQRAYTLNEAKAFLSPALVALQQAQLGQVEERANTAAAALSHFVPAFWSADEAYGVLERTAGQALNGQWRDGLTGWQLSKFRLVLDGTRPPADDWKAVKREATALEEAVSAVAPGRIRRHYHKRSELAALPRPVALIERVLYRETIAMISGKFGTYKSFVGVAMACSLATGKPFLGYSVPEPVSVLYIAAEGVSGIQGRVEAWEAENGPVPDSFGVISVSAQIMNNEDMGELVELVKESGAQVVFWDTLHRNAAGVDENSATEMSQVIRVLDRLREVSSIASVLLHHTGHGGERARGSSSIEDDIDTAFVIKLGDPEDRSKYVQRTIHHRKTKDGELLPEMDIRLNEHPELEGAPAVIALGQAPERDGDEFMIGSLVLREWKLRLDTVAADNPSLPVTTRDEGKDSISKRLRDRFPEMKWRKEDLLRAVKAWQSEG